jgi:hypothetical protein
MDTYKARCTLVLNFADQGELVLNDTLLERPPKAAARARLGTEYNWTNGLKALALCFLEYAARGKDSEPDDFFFEAASLGSPAATLGNAIEKEDTWLGAILGADQIQALFCGSINRSGKSPAPRKIRLNQNLLPPNQVKVMVEQCLVENAQELQTLADRIRKQANWKHPRTGVSLGMRGAPQQPTSAAIKTTAELHDQPTIVVYPFRRISNGPPLFSSPTAKNPLPPQWQDYLDHRIHRHSIFAEVQSKLEAGGWALVLGKGSCGKSVLAASLAVEVIQDSGQCFYLDLSKSDEAYSLKEALVTLRQLAGTQTLFIVDKVHANLEYSQVLVTEWQNYSNGSRMLLLGRNPPSSAVDDYLEVLMQDALTLQVSLEDFEGVFRSVMSRLVHGMTGTPPREVLLAWHEKYRTDLVGFCSEVCTQGSALKENRWQFDPRLSNRRFGQEYLQAAPEDGQKALVQIAALARYGITLPASLVREGILNKAQESGLVLVSEHGRDRHQHFELSDPFQAQAILDVNKGKYEARKAIEDVARQSPFTATALAKVQEQDGNVEEALDLLRLALENPCCFRALIEAGLQYTRVVAKRFTRLGLLTWTELDRRILAEGDALVREMINTPPVILIEFLEFCRLSLPRSNRHILHSLSLESNAEALAARVLDYPLDELVSVVTKLKFHHPPAADQFLASLRGGKHIDRIEQRVTVDPLNVTFTFLKSPRRALPTPVYRCISAALLNPNNRQAFENRLFDLTLHELTNTLKNLAQLNQSVLSNYFIGMLTETKDRLEDVLEEAEVPELLAFEEFAAEKLPKPVQELVATCLASIQSFDLLPFPMEKWPALLSIMQKRHPNLLKSMPNREVDQDRLSRLMFSTPINTVRLAMRALEKCPEANNLENAVVNVLRGPKNEHWRKRWLWRSVPFRTTQFTSFAQKSLPDGTAAQLVRELEEVPPRILEEKLLEIPFSYLSIVLHFAEKDAPQYLAKCLEQLARDDHMGLFRSRALKTPLGDLAVILQDALKYRLSLLHLTISSALLAPENKSRLGDLALTTPLNYTQNFLDYTEKRLPAAFFLVAEALAHPENAPKLIELAEKCWLGELAGFMCFAKERLPFEVYGVLQNYLLNPANQQRVIEKAKKVPVHHLKSALEFLREDASKFHRLLMAELSAHDPQGRNSA